MKDNPPLTHPHIQFPYSNTHNNWEFSKGDVLLKYLLNTWLKKKLSQIDRENQLKSPNIDPSEVTYIDGANPSIYPLVFYGGDNSIDSYYV